MEDTIAVGEYLEKQLNRVSIGYMLQYLAVAQMIEKIIKEKDLTVMTTSARYTMSFTAVQKADVNQSFRGNWLLARINTAN